MNLELVVTLKSGKKEVSKFEYVKDAQEEGLHLSDCYCFMVDSIKLFNCREDGKYLNSWLDIENIKWVNNTKNYEMIEQNFKNRKNAKMFTR